MQELNAHYNIYLFLFDFQADIYAGAIFIQQAVGWNMYVGIVALLVITAIYTVSGNIHIIITKISNIYTMGCPPVRGDNPRALASGLSYVQVDKHGITSLYHLYQCRPCTSRDISC